MNQMQKLEQRARHAYLGAVCWEVREKMTPTDIREIVEGVECVADVMPRDLGDMQHEAADHIANTSSTWAKYQALADYPALADAAAWDLGDDCYRGKDLADRIELDLYIHLRSVLADLDLDEEPVVQEAVEARRKGVA